MGAWSPTAWGNDAAADWFQRWRDPDLAAPPDDTWGFLDMWGNDPEVLAEVEAQIVALEARLADLA